MRFGVREICDVVLRAKAKQTLGSRTFYKNEPVLYFDTLKTSSLEGASTTVYAQGGRGNPRLIAWEGERTLTFTMEDALLSAESFAILSGAGLMEATNDAPIYVHTTSQVAALGDNTLELPEEACWNGGRRNPVAVDDAHYNGEADIFCMKLDENGEIDVMPCVPASVEYRNGKTLVICKAGDEIHMNDIVLVDYYVKRTGKAKLIEITADKFGGNYYLEASTLFRRESDGVDMPAEFIIPNCKVQSNFTFSMASSGDPSTFTFTIDAFPDYVKFDRTHKVLAAIQVIEDSSESEDEYRDRCAATPDPTVNFNQTVATSSADVTVTKSDNARSCSITLSGTDVAAAIDDTATFPHSTDGIILKLNLPVEAGKTYIIEQTNGQLVDYTSDGRVSNATGEYVKTASYDISAANVNETYDLVIGPDTGSTAKVVLKRADGTVIKTYNINNEITFA